MKKNSLKFFLLILILLLIGLITGGVIFAADSVKTLPDKILGNPKAPITIIEYSSFTCSHCAEFHEKTLPLLKQNYIDKGKVRLIFRECPSDRAALFGAAVVRGVPADLYFPVVEALFKHQEKWIFAKNCNREIWKVLRPLGIRRDQINQWISSDDLLNALVKARMRYHKEHKIQETPTFIIQGKVYGHFLSFETLNKILKDCEKTSS